MTAIALVELIQGVAMVSFVVTGGLALCEAIDLGATHRQTVAVIARRRGRLNATVRSRAGAAADTLWSRVALVEVWWRRVRPERRVAIAAGTVALIARRINWNRTTAEHRCHAPIPASAIIARLRAERAERTTP